MFGKEDEKYILGKDAAKNELKKLFDYYEIDVDNIDDEDLKKPIKAGYDRLIKAVRLGRLEIKLEKGIQIIQTLRSGTKITYEEINGVAKSEMDKYDTKAHNRRAQALLGSLSGLGEDAIRQLKSVDLSLAEVLGLIFLVC